MIILNLITFVVLSDYGRFFQPISKQIKCLFDEKSTVFYWIQFPVFVLSYFMRHLIFWLQASEWIIMQHTIDVQRNKKPEQIMFDHMNEKSF